MCAQEAASLTKSETKTREKWGKKQFISGIGLEKIVFSSTVKAESWLISQRTAEGGSDGTEITVVKPMISKQGSTGNGIDLVSRGRRKSKRGNTGVPTICMSYCFCCCCMLRTPGMRPDGVCLIVALDVTMLSWLDILLR